MYEYSNSVHRFNYQHQFRNYDWWNYHRVRIQEGITMTRPNIQIDDEVREMTEEEYADLLASGWTEVPDAS
jgi:hypothetical protein